MTQQINETPIYLDWAATAPADRDILLAAANIAADFYGNPSSVHTMGQQARNVLEDARTRCAKLFKVKPQQLYFTSGGTESDQFPLLSLLQRPTPGSIVISAVEHPAITNQAEQLAHLGWNIITVKPDHSGIIHADTIKSALQKDTCLVMVQAVNNETGAIHPIQEIATMLADYGKTNRKPKFHVDAVQALGKIPLTPGFPGIDSLAFSAHKIGGARGCGLLYLKDRIEPFIRGGEQESGIRPGTENVAGAVSLCLCLEKHLNNLTAEIVAAEQRTAHLIDGLRSIPGCEIIPADRTANDPLFSPFVVQASFKNIPGEVTVRGLSANNIYISTGSACSSKKKSRPVLSAMGITAEQAQTAVRFSTGVATTDTDIETTLSVLRDFTNSFTNGVHSV